MLNQLKTAAYNVYMGRGLNPNKPYNPPNQAIFGTWLLGSLFVLLAVTAICNR